MRFLFLVLASILLAQPLAAKPSNMELCFSPLADSKKQALIVRKACKRALNGKFNSSQMHAAVLSNLGYAERQLGHIRTSRAVLVKAVNLAPENTKILWNYTDTLERAGDTTRLEIIYARLIRLDDGFEVRFRRCLLRIRKAEFDGAVEDCKIAVRKNRKNLSALFHLTKAQNVSGAHAAALRSARRGMSEDTGGEFYFQAFYAQQAMGNYRNAMITLRNGLKKFPKNKSLQRAYAASIELAKKPGE